MSFPPGLISFKALIEESEMKKFPDNDLLRHLRLVTQDADKCASVAQQLLNGKRQTRQVPLHVCSKTGAPEMDASALQDLKIKRGFVSSAEPSLTGRFSFTMCNKLNILSFQISSSSVFDSQSVNSFQLSLKRKNVMVCSDKVTLSKIQSPCLCAVGTVNLSIVQVLLFSLPSVLWKNKVL